MMKRLALLTSTVLPMLLALWAGLATGGSARAEGQRPVWMAELRAAATLGLAPLDEAARAAALAHPEARPAIALETLALGLEVRTRGRPDRLDDLLAEALLAADRRGLLDGRHAETVSALTARAEAAAQQRPRAVLSASGRARYQGPW